MKRTLLCLLACLLLLCALPAAAESVAPKYVEDIAKVVLDRYALNLYAGQYGQLLSRVGPASRAHEKVRWDSDNGQVATVSEKGNVLAHKAGTAIITATAGTGAKAVTAQCRVTVKFAPVKSITLSNQQIALSRGDHFTLSAAKFAPSYAYDRSLLFSSQNPRIAAVDPLSGVITGVSPGKTRIKAMASNGKSAFCTVTVSEAVRARAVKPSKAAAVISFEQQLQLTATVSPATAIAQDKVISWSSGNPRVATVDQNGLITSGTVKGAATITLETANGRKATCKVTVKPIAVASITFGPNLSQKINLLNVGEQLTITPTILPERATHREVSWSSSAPEIASVENGVITAHAPGSANIKAFAGGKSAQCSVTVRSKDIRTLTITAGGDITLGGDPRFPASSPASQRYYDKLYTASGGALLHNLRSSFSGKDEISLINLESNLTTSGKYRNKTYVFRANPSYAHLLSDAGIEIAGHANNHAQDFASGARDTYNAIQNSGGGMSYVGNGHTAQYVQNGVRVGFCAFSQMAGTSNATVNNVISRLKRSCDVVVASIHWGSEFVYSSSPAQRSLGRSAILAGADLVVGHHPHVVGGIEKYRGKYIVYSLGTLSSAIVTPKDMDTFLFRQTFSVDLPTGTVEDQSVKLIPCSMSTNENLNDAMPYVLSGSARARVLNKIKHYSSAYPETLPSNCFE